MDLIRLDDHLNTPSPGLGLMLGARQHAMWFIAARVRAAAIAAGAPPFANWSDAIDTLAVDYAPASVRLFRASFAGFERWCALKGRTATPADGETVAAHFADVAQGLARSTLRVRLKAIRLVHAMLGLPDPTDDPLALQAYHRAIRACAAGRGQALGVTRELRERLIAACPSDSPRGLRDRAMIAVAYSGLLRRDELTELCIEDLETGPDGHLRLLLRQAKTDRLGEGQVAYALPSAAGHLERWIAAAGIDSGRLFRAVRGSFVCRVGVSGRTLNRVVKAAAAAAGCSPAEVERIRAHSLRIGSAQDMAARGYTTPQIMRAGRWRTASQMHHYIGRAEVNVRAPRLSRDPDLD